MPLALIAAILLGGGTFLILRRGMLRVLVGFTMFSHGVNLILLLSANVVARQAPIGQSLDPTLYADPLPQSLVLTAIVISFAVTILLLGMSVVGDGDDDTEIELEGRRMETPDILSDDELAALMRASVSRADDQDWHAYVDRSDDAPDAVDVELHQVAPVVEAGRDDASGQEESLR